MTTWYLVADASRARILERDTDGKTSIIQNFEHPNGRAHAGDLSEDLGRTRQTGSSVYAAESDERDARRDAERQKFAHSLADALKRGAMENAYDELVIVASPHFLGLLKPTLHAKVEERIIAIENKGLADLSERELLQREDILGLSVPH